MLASNRNSTSFHSFGCRLVSGRVNGSFTSYWGLGGKGCAFGLGGGATRINPPPGRRRSRARIFPCASRVTLYEGVSGSVSDTKTPFQPSAVFSARKSTPASQPLLHLKVANSP